MRGYWSGGRPPHRGAARRSADGRGHAVHAASGRLRQAADLMARAQADRRLRDFGRRLSGEAPGKPFARGRPRQPQGQGRCGRERDHHAVLLRQCALPALPRALPRARASGRRSCRASCRSTTSRRSRASRAGRRHDAGWLARRFEGLDDDPGDLAAGRPPPSPPSRSLDLVDEGIRQFHFYTLNRADLVICDLPSAGPAGARPVDSQGGGQRMTRGATHRRAEGCGRQAHPDHRRRHGHDDPALQVRRGRLFAASGSPAMPGPCRATTTCWC